MMVSSSASTSQVSNIWNSSASQVRLIFTLSARPFTKWRRGRVARVSGSTTTSFGCQKAPTMFLVRPRSTATLPPMEESIWERVVVGQLMKSTPRM